MACTYIFLEEQGAWLDAVGALWNLCFNDSKDWIERFLLQMPVRGIVVAKEDSGRTVGMTVLLRTEGNGQGYYGYAVCVHPDFRGQGICAGMHQKIRSFCEQERAAYFVHPADQSLEALYAKLGLSVLQREYEIQVTTKEQLSYYTLSPAEYSMLRRMCYGGAGFRDWSASAMAFFFANGYTAIGFDTDAGLGAACLLREEGIVCELCTPPGREGQGAVITSSAMGGQARVRLPGQSPQDRCTVMGFGAETGFYFNLFGE